MGKKISVDSSTLMNKVLEVIEAKKIFQLDYDQISILIHPKSYIHALVKFNDGIIKLVAHDTTMEIPIFNTIYDNGEMKLRSKKIDINKLNNLNLKKVNVIKFPFVKILKYNPAIVVDFGTATTFDVIGKKGSYEGGIIAPGINLSVDALYRSTSRLPKITIKSLENENKSLVGKDTVSAMESGIYWGYVCMIDGLIYKLKKIYKDSKVIATGGLTEVFKKDIKSIDLVEKNLTITGLAHIYIDQFRN